MLTIDLRFPAGRYHATAWGRNVNEGVPEWPPSPWRLLRALVDTWHRKLAPGWSPERVVPLLEALATRPPRFDLPPARVSHTRSYLHQNKSDPTAKKLVFDAFVVVDPEARVRLRWDDLVLSDAERSDLDHLLAQLNYLGRSESWVEARVGEDDEGGFTSFLVEDGPAEEAEVVHLACMESAESYRRHPWKVGKGRKQRDMHWLEALSVSTKEFLDQGMSRPPGQLQRAYWRPRVALDAPLPRARRPRSRRICAALYELSGPTLPRVIEALEIGEQARRRLMGIHKKVIDSEAISARFSGKDAQGRPARGHHHLSYLARDLDGDGRLDHLLVWGPDALQDDELEALRRLRSLHLRGRPDLDCAVSGWGDADSLRPVSRTLTSTTPFVPSRHRKARRDGPEGPWLEAEVRRELAHRGLPAPLAVEPVESLALSGRQIPWRDFRRSRKGEALRRGHGFRLVFSEPVASPISLGYGSHFGLGQFEVDER